MRKQWKTITHVLPRILCVFMAFHFFNVSMDSKDARPDFIPEDLSQNDIESISEFVTEVVLGVDNSFAEHDEQDEGAANVHSWMKLLMCSIAPNTLTLSFETACVRYYVMNARIIQSNHSKIKVPPPQFDRPSPTVC